MAKLTPISTGPQIGNRFATEELVKGVENIKDQAKINSAIKRIKRLRGQFDAIAKASNRIGKSIKSQAGILKEKAVSDAERLRKSVDKQVNNAEVEVSKLAKSKDAIIEAFSQRGGTSSGKIPLETGKGRNLSINA